MNHFNYPAGIPASSESIVGRLTPVQVAFSATAAAISLASDRQFEIRLKFAEGEIVKTVYLDDPQMTIETANARIRTSRPDTDSLTKFGGQDYGDILKADVRNGMILECRDNKLIAVLHFAQSGGHVFATDFEILDPSQKAPSETNA